MEQAAREIAGRLVTALETIVEIDRQQHERVLAAKEMARETEQAFQRFMELAQSGKREDASEAFWSRSGRWSLEHQQRDMAAGAQRSLDHQRCMCEVDDALMRLWSVPQLRPHVEALSARMRALRLLAVEGSAANLPLLQNDLKPVEGFIEQFRGESAEQLDREAARARRLDYVSGIMDRMREATRAQGTRFDAQIARQEQLLDEALEISRRIQDIAEQ